MDPLCDPATLSALKDELSTALTTLEGVTNTMSDRDIVVQDAQKIAALAPQIVTLFQGFKDQQTKDAATIADLQNQIANPTPTPGVDDNLNGALSALSGLVPAPAPTDAPVASDLSLTTSGGAAVSVPFAATDSASGFSGEAFTFAVVTEPTLGAVSPDPLNASGFIYTPNAAGNGSDTFTYTATGQTSGVVSAPATVTVVNS